tara:strand:- start:5870 stop:7045 length:1176 start_codon:yes stop_codon:yes gene_type:complete
MWAYGITKDTTRQLLKIPNGERIPSLGISRLDVPIPKLSHDEVLIRVKSSALNYNTLWSSLIHPVSPFQLIQGHVARNPHDRDHLQEYAIFGSDAAGVIVETGPGVREWRIGDHVVVHCNVIKANENIAQVDGMLPLSQSIWGYETNFGAFAEFTKVKSNQLIQKPGHISWENAGSFCLTLSTAYRMLLSKNAYEVKPNDNCLVWGGAGGLGTFAIQLIQIAGGNPVVVVSSDEKAEICKDLGVKFIVNRAKEDFSDFVDSRGRPNYLKWRKAQKILEKKGVDSLQMVFEHVGKETLGLSLFLLERGGVVVTCAASSGYNATIDLRYLWMSLKRIIGSHFANYYEAQKAAELIWSEKIKPVIHSVSSINDLPKMADLMYYGHTYGKIVFKH